MRLLVVEDDDRFANLLVELLQTRNYVVERAADGRTARQLLAIQGYDLLILDVHLPDMNGTELCQRLRQEGHETPILFLSAWHSSDDRVRGLDSGADKYLAKSADWNALLADIRAMLRRSEQEAPPVFLPEVRCGELRIDLQTRETYYGDRQLDLSPKQTLLLECFLRQPSQILDWQAIADRVYDLHSEPKTRETVRSHLRGLRRKLKTVGLDNLIATVYGLGYQLQINVLESALQTATTDPANQRLQIMLDRSWELYRSSICDDVAALATFAQQLEACTAQLPAMQQRAHNLHGLLGTLKHRAAASRAAEIEQVLRQPNLLSHLTSLDGQLEQLRAAITIRPDLLVVSDDRFFVSDLQQAAAQQQLSLRVVMADDAAAESPLKALEPQALLLSCSASRYWQHVWSLAAACQPRPTFLLTDESTPEPPPPLARAIRLPRSLSCSQILERIQPAIAASPSPTD